MGERPYTLSRRHSRLLTKELIFTNIWLFSGARKNNITYVINMHPTVAKWHKWLWQHTLTVNLPSLLKSDFSKIRVSNTPFAVTVLWNFISVFCSLTPLHCLFLNYQPKHSTFIWLCYLVDMFCFHLHTSYFIWVK